MSSAQHLSDRIAALEEVLGQDQSLTSRLRDAYHLEPIHAQILGMLYKRDFVTRDGLYTVLYEGRPESDWPEEKILDVQMCKLRAHLRKRGDKIVIATKWGQGWVMSQASREVIKATLGRKPDADGLPVAPDAPKLSPAGCVVPA